MSIFILFVKARVLFEGALILWVPLNGYNKKKQLHAWIKLHI